MKHIEIRFWDNDVFDENYSNPAFEKAEPYLQYIEPDSEYQFQTFVGSQFKGTQTGYAFGLFIPEKKIIRFFKVLPVNATLEQIQAVISNIRDGNYKYVETNDSGNGQYKDKWIELPVGGEDPSSGINPLDILPDWLNDLMNNILDKLGLTGLKLGWYIYAAAAAYTATKLLQKNSNKILWGGLTTLLLFAALKAHNDSKKNEEVKTV